MNTTSVLLANAAGNPVRIINGVSRPAETFAIVAGKNGPASIEELKGATVAGPKGTVLHQMLVAALNSKGMTIDDVNFISMKLPRARTAMLAGKIDAALLAASLVIKSVDAGAHIVTTADLSPAGSPEREVISTLVAFPGPGILDCIEYVTRAAAARLLAGPRIF